MAYRRSKSFDTLVDDLHLQAGVDDGLLSVLAACGSFKIDDIAGNAALQNRLTEAAIAEVLAQDNLKFDSASYLAMVELWNKKSATNSVPGGLLGLLSLAKGDVGSASLAFTSVQGKTMQFDEKLRYASAKQYADQVALDPKTLEAFLAKTGGPIAEGAALAVRNSIQNGTINANTPSALLLQTLNSLNDFYLYDPEMTTGSASNFLSAAESVSNLLLNSADGANQTARESVNNLKTAVEDFIINSEKMALYDSLPEIIYQMPDALFSEFEADLIANGRQTALDNFASKHPEVLNAFQLDRSPSEFMPLVKQIKSNLDGLLSRKSR